jgi:ribose transport system ATP-binding protein
VTGAPVAATRGITKRFPGVVALDGVDLSIERGEIHALVGENGAGKSTLIKLLSGVYQADSGEIYVAGDRVEFANPREAQELGVTTIHQERTLAPHLSALQNIFLGRELRRRRLGRIVGVLDDREMRTRVTALCEDFDFDAADLDRPVEAFGALKQHVVEIIKALAFRADLVILDEPTAGLTETERDALFAHMRRLREHDVGVIWVTHRLEELVGLADRATVLRDGVAVGTLVPDADAIGELIRMMVGRDVESLEELADQTSEAAGAQREQGEEVLRVEGLCRAGVLHDVSFTLHRGEIVGLAGLAGAGRTELARAIVGADKTDAGSVSVQGRVLSLGSPRDSYRAGIAIVPEERKTHGIFADLSLSENVSAAALPRILRARLLLDRRREHQVGERYVRELGIRTPSPRQKIGLLSGGNQQKGVIARSFFTQPKVIIFDEPTQGIDVGAKVEVYRLIEEYVSQGGAALVISSELPELLGLSDRVLVIREGRIVAEYPGRQRGESREQTVAQEEHILAAATGAERANGR